MNQRDIVSTLADITRKLADHSEITGADVENMAKAARSTGRIDHRVMYAEAARIMRDGPDEAPPAPVEPPAVTVEDVKAAYEKARKSGRIEDRAAYAILNRKLQEETQ